MQIKYMYLQQHTPFNNLINDKQIYNTGMSDLYQLNNSFISKTVHYMNFILPFFSISRTRL